MKKVLVSAAVFFLLCFGSTVQATPVLWSVDSGGNGHYYEVITGSYTWNEADNLADTLKFYGMQGHLATITSAEENAFILGLNLTYWGVWLGGYQDRLAGDYSEPDGGWRWVTGEKWSYTDWAPPGPNNNFAGTGIAEDYLELAAPWKQWNDFPNDPRSNMEYYRRSDS